MVTTFDLTAIRSNNDVSAELNRYAPQVVTAMLQNVYLRREKTAPPVEHGGDFWFWKLTAYGLALMRALVRASGTGFSYAETFMEPDLDAIPQLVLMDQINTTIQSQITHIATSTDWATILDHSPFLYEKRIVVDPMIFQHEVDRLVEQVRQGHYDLSGSRQYYPALQV